MKLRLFYWIVLLNQLLLFQAKTALANVPEASFSMIDKTGRQMRLADIVWKKQNLIIGKDTIFLNQGKVSMAVRSLYQTRCLSGEGLGVFNLNAQELYYVFEYRITNNTDSALLVAPVEKPAQIWNDASNLIVSEDITDPSIHVEAWSERSIPAHTFMQNVIVLKAPLFSNNLKLKPGLLESAKDFMYQIPNELPFIYNPLDVLENMDPCKKDLSQAEAESYRKHFQESIDNAINAIRQINP